MSVSLDLFVNNLRPHLNGCPDFVIKDELRRALNDFFKRTRILRRTFQETIYPEQLFGYDNYSFVINTQGKYPSMWPIEILSPVFIGSARFSIYKDDVSEELSDFSSVKTAGDTGKLKSNAIYYKINNLYDIQMFSFEELEDDTVATLTVVFTPAINDDETVDDFIYYDHHKLIEAYVKTELQAVPGKEWFDPQQAAVNYRKYQQGINKTKIDNRLSRNNHSLHVKMRSF